VAIVVNARPGYWDLDLCSWVGTEPMYVVPPARTGDHRSDRVPGGREAAADGVPAPREDEEAVGPTPGAPPA
jgi:hypothetical protein